MYYKNAYSMIKAFLKHGYLLREYRTNITLIPKNEKDSMKKVIQYRLISLCNVSYKFISKILLIVASSSSQNSIAFSKYIYPKQGYE